VFGEAALGLARIGAEVDVEAPASEQLGHERADDRLVLDQQHAAFQAIGRRRGRRTG